MKISAPIILALILSVAICKEKISSEASIIFNLQFQRVLLSEKHLIMMQEKQHLQFHME